MLDPHTSPPGLSEAQVCQRFASQAGKMRQALTHWRHNNPGQHAEYFAEHLLLETHYPTEALLAVLEAEVVGPADVLALAARLRGQGLAVEGLVYGNASEGEALGESLDS